METALMSEKLRITCLIDNCVGSGGLAAELGLSFFVEWQGAKILFDTGQTGLVIRNAQRLKVDLAQTQAIVLSHGHYDHTGGLEPVLAIVPPGELFVHPTAFAPKFSTSGGARRAIGVPNLTAETIAARGWKINWTNQPTAVRPGLMVTGPIPRLTAYEDIGGPMFSDEACQVADPLLDDQAIYIQTDSGVVVLLGCAHAGVINTLRYIRQLTGGAPLRGVIGGMHLLNAPAQRLKATMDELADEWPALLAPAHCTGIRATTQLWNLAADRCRECGVGARFEFD
jgi:7,8-dihydropterin-6-yl-methyl-4-(beta-D-ribofuranosyl)aminobenzene 5'-phosphate synthase